MNRISLFLVMLVASAGLWAIDTNQHRRTVNSQSLDEVAVPTFQKEISTPEVSEKQSPRVAAYMRKEAEALYKLQYSVETMRKGEVVIAVIPTDKLFAPNETGLNEVYAQKLLEPFNVYFRQPGKFKIVVAVHTDDTGKPSYTKQLSQERANAVEQWFRSHATVSGNLFSFGMGAEQPLVPNNTRDNRATNRRLEIYIEPGDALINEVMKRR